MPRLTVTLPEDQAEMIEEKAGDSGEYESKSEVVREFIRRGERAEDLERERDQLREQLQAANSRIDEHQELVEYVDAEKSLQERRRRREEMKHQANILKRFKWTLTGMPAPEEADE